MNYSKLAGEIIANVGGIPNISEVTHCFTRLRLVLKDKKMAKKEAISRLEGVITVVEGGGQLQIVIGNKVEKVYDEIMVLTGGEEHWRALRAGRRDGEASGTDNSGQKWYSSAFQVLSSTFTPLVPAIAASGLLKGILTAAKLIAAGRGIDITASDTYVVLFAASQIIFYYMPIFLAFTAAKAIKTSAFTAMIIGGLLVYPEMDALIQNVSAATRVLGLPVIKGSWQIGDATKVFSYVESVIPVLLVVIVLKYVERFLKKVIPEVLQVILVPGLSLIVMVPLTLSLLGPVGIYIGNGIQVVYNAVIGFNTVLGGAVIGGLWCVLVAFGAHRALVPISINDVAVTGSQTLMAMSSPANFAQGGAALGVMMKTKNKELRSVAASTSLTAALAGITEPALYGCNLRLKKPMVCAVVSGAAGGAIIGWGGVFAESHVNGCLLTAVAYAAGGMGKFVIYLIGCAIAFFGAAALTYLVGFDDDVASEPPMPEERSKQSREKEGEDYESGESSAVSDPVPELADIAIASPVKGDLIPLDRMADEVFASGALGKGAAVIPESGEITAPGDCEVSVLYETGHAIGLKMDSGVELLIHVGVNTVELNGRYFQKHVTQGDCVKKGTGIVSFDIARIKEAGYDPTVAVIVSNTADYRAVARAETRKADKDTDILLLAK